MFEFSSSLLASLVVGLFTLIGAYVARRSSAAQKHDDEKHREELEGIARTLHTEQVARKAATVERVIERIPIGLTREQFSELLTSVADRLPTPLPTGLGLSAVESLINNYHEQALSQARAQFWFSVVAATVGFAWILYAGSTVTPENLASLWKTLPGAVMDAVAFLFFRQASETRQRATELYDRLRRDRQMSDSAILVSSIDDVRLRSAVKAQLALHMSGLSPTPIDLGAFLSGDRSSVERDPHSPIASSTDPRAKGAAVPPPGAVRPAPGCPVP
jgi:hypothetical protein